MLTKIRIKLKSFDNRVLDKSSAEIVAKAKRTGAVVTGPIPLPTKIERFCVLRSPHADKKSREHFERRSHARLIEIREHNDDTISELKKMDLPAGVEVEVKSN
ncbi:MAG: 30S ribosomal protein S10 [Candidatus Aminicenantes bacterium]|jgi:small subunit ribosomal protein S10|nr:30S ribosomal protein S10 [Acidobacteriota bacterium]MCG2810595.1 30S ribosomal protein S10 [Candidatus Aminicenantes bacterium]MCJ7524044.1 30S ribosomal protein S10 [Candidatus Aminicenantes bacterium]TFG77630.1 MAG: 30S ribosomal protein S10 [Chrysiogenales bacterium]